VQRRLREWRIREHRSQSEATDDKSNGDDDRQREQQISRTASQINVPCENIPRPRDGCVAETRTVKRGLDAPSLRQEYFQSIRTIVLEDLQLAN
jgi:hypothetical protein